MEVAYRSQQQHLAHHQQGSRVTESKPRLSKEEVDILEAEFQKNHKPSTNIKKSLAESMRVENARINVSSVLFTAAIYLANHVIPELVSKQTST